MTDKPKILTVAEIDGIIMRAEMYGSHELTDDTARSLCRMARAMAVAEEYSISLDVDDRLVSCGGWCACSTVTLRGARRHSAVEAIEATEEP